MRHFAHYVRRTVAEPDYASAGDRYFIENQPDDQGFFSPAFHAAPHNSGVATRVEIGDSIWLFSQLSSCRWGVLPPALDAVIRVTDTCKVGILNNFRFSAGEGSRWFPLYDATALLGRLKTVSASGQPGSLLTQKNKSGGQALRLLRQISDAAPLLEYAETLANLRPHFISYRLIDGTEPAFHLANDLIRNQSAVFWDRWSLPRRLAERREFVRDSELDRFIEQCIQQSQRVHGICSPLYSEPGSYSLREQELARKLGIFHPHDCEP